MGTFQGVLGLHAVFSDFVAATSRRIQYNFTGAHPASPGRDTVKSNGTVGASMVDTDCRPTPQVLDPK